jgi:hypothetical protein
VNLDRRIREIEQRISQATEARERREAKGQIDYEAIQRELDSLDERFGERRWRAIAGDER